MSFIQNGDTVTFDEYFMVVPVQRAKADGTGYEEVARNAYVYGGAATGDATEQMKYSQVDSKFCTEGTFSDTFDAAYNVKEINVPDEWISNTMSYHFTVKN